MAGDAVEAVRDTPLHRAGLRIPIPLRWIHPAVSAVLTNGPGLSDARCLDAIDTAWLRR